MLVKKIKLIYSFPVKGKKPLNQCGRPEINVFEIIDLQMLNNKPSGMIDQNIKTSWYDWLTLATYDS